MPDRLLEADPGRRPPCSKDLPAIAWQSREIRRALPFDKAFYGK
jgi:hypothetical protein